MMKKSQKVGVFMELSTESKAMFESMNEGILVIDHEGRIVFANQAYLKFIGKNDLEIVGQLLREVRPGARLPEVITSRKPILHAPRAEWNDEVYFVNMYPIFVNKQIVGGLSIITFIGDAYNFRTELEAYEKHSKQLLQRVSKANTARYTFDSIVAIDDNGKTVKELAIRAAKTDATILLASESGTGKELYAQAIHNASLRGHEVFVAINCANFNTNMLESEIFGYVEGAFTGAKKGGKIGLFEAANGGTIFLDEISEMDVSLQAKLLRVLQERRIRPIGAINEVELDVRVICASNADLPSYIENKQFRKDLFYRLSTFQIQIPPLRQRRGDIPVLCEVILNELSKKLKRSITISADALECLMMHDWPGNVRELRNVLEFSAYLSDNGVIVIESLPESISRHVSASSSTLAQRVEMYEKSEIHKLLSQYGNNLEGKKRVSKELGISLATLYNKQKNKILKY